MQCDFASRADVAGCGGDIGKDEAGTRAQFGDAGSVGVGVKKRACSDGGAVKHRGMQKLDGWALGGGWEERLHFPADGCERSAERVIAGRPEAVEHGVGDLGVEDLLADRLE